MKKILLATHNPGKIIEYRGIFSDIPVQLVTLSDLKIKDEPEENANTFLENAIDKAKFYSGYTNLPVLAEDSGLEIDYLNGEPGVHSRRWLGYKASDSEILDKLQKEMQGVPKEQRGAQFSVVVALKIPGREEVFTAEGESRGYISENVECDITPGFPFRSVFYVPEIGKVLGKLSMAEEGKIGHRSKAMRKLFPVIKRELKVSI
jgi:XTP/dITP diphosphohydrolase